MGGLLTAVCADTGFVPRVRHEVSETSTLVTLVAAGLGTAVVLEPSSLGVDLVAAHLVDATSPAIERALVVLRRITQWPFRGGPLIEVALALKEPHAFA